MHRKSRQVQEAMAGSRDRQGRSSTMAGGGTAMLRMAEDDDKQLLAKPDIPQLTTDATGHMRASQGLSGADTSLSCSWAGRKKLWGVPDHPNPS